MNEKEGKENIPEEFKDLRQRTFGQALTANMSSLITIVLCMSVYFIFMTDLSAPSFKQVGSLSITSILIWIVNNMTYRTQFEAGEERARQDKDYVRAKEEYLEVRKNVENTEDGSTKLEEFCEKLNKDRLISLKKAILFGLVEYPLYERLCALSKKQLKNWHETDETDEVSRGGISTLTKHQINAILTAKKAKVIKMTARQLLSTGCTETSTSSLLPRYTAVERKRKSKNRKGLTSLITCCFIGLIVIEPTLKITWNLILAATLKILPILWGAYNGRMNGNNNIIVFDKEYIEQETNYLKQFLKTK